jgi:hypothetical protein
VRKTSKLALLLLGLCALAQENKQTPPKSSPPATQPNPPGQPSPASSPGPPAGGPPTKTPDSNHFTGMVHDTSNGPLKGALVTIKRKDLPTIQVQAFTDSDTGHYESPPIPPGTYDLVIEKPGYEKAVIPDRTLREGLPQNIDVTLTADARPGPLWGAVLAILFLASIFVTRWHNIAVPNRKALVSRIEDLQLRARTANLDSERHEQLDRVKSGLTKINAGMFRDFLFWSLGQENAAWGTVHFVEMELLDKIPMAPDRVAARLTTAQQQLAGSDNGMAKAMAARIKQAFDCKDPATTASAYQELLSEVQYYQYNVSDTEFAQLTSWQNKAVWLTLVGVMLILVLAYAADHWTLFVAGAAGGFLSRMSKQVKRADVPNDYGASWSTLFLSPVLGALSGWFGVLLIAFASDPEFGLVGGPLKQIMWNNPFAPGTLFGGFLLGFSERLFDGLVSRLEAQIDKKEEAAKKAPDAPVVLPKVSPEVSNLTPPHGLPGALVTARLASLESTKVERVAFVSAADGKETEAHMTRPDARTIEFEVPAVAPGQYRVRLFTPAPLDAGVTFRILEKLAISTTSPLPNATHGVPYNQEFRATGGAAPYKWTSSNPPTWLTLAEPTGKMGGTPTVAAPATKFKVTVIDSAGSSVSADFELPVD